MFSYCITEFCDWPVVIEIDTRGEEPTAEIVYGGQDEIGYSDCAKWIKEMTGDE